MMTSVPANDVHAAISLMANHMPAAMMAAKATDDVLSAVGRLRYAR
jgi:hypothetical protein